jgi:hypothetical protein
MGFQQALVNQCKRDIQVVNISGGNSQNGEVWQILISANTSLIAIQVAVVSCGGSKQA